MIVRGLWTLEYACNRNQCIQQLWRQAIMFLACKSWCISTPILHYMKVRLFSLTNPKLGAVPAYRHTYVNHDAIAKGSATEIGA